MKTQTLELPEYYAGFLINADSEGLDQHELTELAAELAAHGVKAKDCLSVGDSAWVGKFNGVLTMMSHYTFRISK